MVMVLIGILGAVAMSRFFDRSSVDVRTFSDQTLAMLRYGQKMAIAQNRPVYVRLNGASIALCFDSACSVTVPAPGAGNDASAATLAACGGTAHWFCAAPDASVRYASAPATPWFYFNALGKPYAAADAPGAVDSSFAALAIQIRRSSESQTVFVEIETGYVHQ